jgi:DNA-binding transcriptional regulator YiaG
MSKRKDTELAKMIRDLRAKLGLTQEQFAAKVGVTWSTVNRWENGRGCPSPLARRRIEELQDEFGKSEQEARS